MKGIVPRGPLTLKTIARTIMLIINWLTSLGRYLQLMGRTFSRPERMRMFFRQYVREMAQLGVDSIGIVMLISFFIEIGRAHV